MKKAFCAAAVIFSTQALAQAPSGDVVPVPLNAQERAAILSMCPAAVWAQRQNFDGMCEYLKAKFEAAVKAAAEKPDTEKKE